MYNFRIYTRKNHKKGGRSAAFNVQIRSLNLKKDL